MRTNFTESEISLIYDTLSSFFNIRLMKSGNIELKLKQNENWKFIIFVRNIGGSRKLNIYRQIRQPEYYQGLNFILFRNTRNNDPRFFSNIIELLNRFSSYVIKKIDNNVWDY